MHPMQSRMDTGLRRTIGAAQLASTELTSTTKLPNPLWLANTYQSATSSLSLTVLVFTADTAFTLHAQIELVRPLHIGGFDHYALWRWWWRSMAPGEKCWMGKADGGYALEDV